MINKEEWYSLRNDRTNRVDEVLLNDYSKRVGVILHETSIKINQSASLLFLNTLSRWCRRISIQTCNLSLTSTGSNFEDALASTINDADKYVDLKFEKIDRENCDYIVEIGADKISDSDVFWLDFNGWISGFGCGKKSYNLKNNRDSNNIIGASFAAASLNAEIFALYLGINNKEIYETYYSLFNFEKKESPINLKNPTINTSLNFGNIWQVGCGAVGSNFDYLLSLMDVNAKISLIDYDVIDIFNTSSSLVFNSNDVLNNEGVKKVDRCYELLSDHPSIVIEKTDGDFSEFIDQRNLKDAQEKKYPDVVLCFANERNVWSSIQYNEPPYVLASTTSRNWTVNFFRHIPFTERCIVCTFGAKPHQFKPVCSQGVEVTSDGAVEKLGSLPFLSLTAATLVLAELIKLSLLKDKKYPANANFLQIWFKKIKDAQFQSLQINKTNGCSICEFQNESEYHENFKKSLHFKKLY